MKYDGRHEGQGQSGSYVSYLEPEKEGKQQCQRPETIKNEGYRRNNLVHPRRCSRQ